MFRLLFCSIFFIVQPFCSGSSYVGIIGGQDISISKAPYMASLRYNGTIHYCGASIIHKRFVISAAHCIIPNIMYKILVGTSYVDEGGSLYEIEKLIVHKNYSSDTKDFDISLIKLKTALNYGPNVAKISLDDGKFKFRNDAKFSVTGWGAVDNQGTFPSQLKQAKVSMMSRYKCQCHYWTTRITPRMICAGGVYNDACQGDSGGPLTYKNIQVGISSFGHKCGISPGVYTKVSTLLPWIQENIASNI